MERKNGWVQKDVLVICDNSGRRSGVFLMDGRGQVPALTRRTVRVRNGA